MELGLALPQFDFSVPGSSRLEWTTVVAWARRAEELGFTSLWLADHIFLGLSKYGGPADDHEGFEPFGTLAALARRTTTPRLGTLVVCSPLRPARVTAKAFTTLDRISGGRVIAGVGAGWNEPEFVEAGVPFERPGARLAALADDIGAMRSVWTDDARRPPPVQPGGPPIWVGGRGDRLLDLVAAHADGWNTVWQMTPAAYRERLDVLHRACERHGRDPAEISLSLGLGTLIVEHERELPAAYAELQRLSPPGVIDGLDLETYREGRLVGTAEQVAETLAALSALGVSTVIVNLGAVPFAVTSVAALELIAAAVTL